MLKILLGVLLIAMINLVQASDFAKEQRWADQVVDSILDGEAVWLEAENRKFLSIYTTAEEGSSRGLIVMHGTGIHPNWSQVIQPLRIEMALKDWNTLSIQMPVLPNEASHEEYAPLFSEVVPRIDAAVDYLQMQGNRQIVLVGHSLGSLMGSFYLSKNPASSIKGFIAIGMPGGSKHPEMNSLETLKPVRIPVLDLFGSEDLPEVLAHRQDKKQAAINTEFEQLEIDGANHFFDDKDEALIDAVNGWLEDKF